MWNLVLIGKTGSGKSSTGNSILFSKMFTISSGTNRHYDVSNSVKANVFYNGNEIAVIDGLDVCSCGEKADFSNVETALSLSENSITAFLLVVKYGERFSEESRNVIKMTKDIFGDDVINKFTILVVTHGDDFNYNTQEEQGSCKTIEEWLESQTGDLKKLYFETNKKVVLFDNKAKKETHKKQQVENLFTFIRGMNKLSYTKTDYDFAVHKRNILLLRKLSSDENAKCDIFIQGMRDAISLAKKTKDTTTLEKIFNKLMTYEHDTRMKFEECPKLCEEIMNKIKIVLQEVQLIMKVHNAGFLGSEEQINILPCFIRQEQKTERNEMEKEINEKVHVFQKNEKSNGPNKMKLTEEKKEISVDVEQFQGLKQNEVVLLLMGSAGKGKSSTGNSIIGKRVFQTSDSTSTTLNMKYIKECICIGGKNYAVVDGPGIDTDESQETICKLHESVEKALKVCNYRFSALLIVLRYGDRFTERESKNIKFIKDTLGQEVIKKYGICILTHGDNWGEDNTDEKINFISWCTQQQGEIKELFEDCQHRCVLFNNHTNKQTEKNSQVLKLLEFVSYDKHYSLKEYDEVLRLQRNGMQKSYNFLIPTKIEKDIFDCSTECLNFGKVITAHNFQSKRHNLKEPPNPTKEPIQNKGEFQKRNEHDCKESYFPYLQNTSSEISQNETLSISIESNIPQLPEVERKGHSYLFNDESNKTQIAKSNIYNHGEHGSILKTHTKSTLSSRLFGCCFKKRKTSIMSKNQDTQIIEKDAHENQFIKGNYSSTGKTKYGSFDKTDKPYQLYCNNK